MTTARSQHTATLLQSGQVLVVGGQRANVIGPETAEVYTPSTNSWQKVLNKPNQRRNAHTATLLPDGRVLVTGGDFGGSLATAEIFDPGNDPVNGTWVLVSPMNDPRSFHTAILLPNGMVLVAGGTPDSQLGLSSAELFDPTTGTWSRTSAMNGAHVGHTATLFSFGPQVSDFVVLVAGGSGNFKTQPDEIVSTAELYTPAPPVVKAPVPEASPDGSSWVQTGSMSVARMFHTATTFPVAGGPFGPHAHQLLVAGGVDPAVVMTGGLTTEIYDSATGSWLPTGNMQVSRTGHTATLLSGGNILLAGGGDSSAEIGTACDANAMIVVSPPQTIDFGQVEAGSLNVATSNFLPTVQNTGNAVLTFEQAIEEAMPSPGAALFALSGAVGRRGLSPQAGPCLTGSIGDDSGPVFVQFSALSPVAKVCQATLTLGGSNAANALPGQTWVFPITAQIVVVPTAVITIVAPSFPLVPVGSVANADLVITLEFQISEANVVVVRFPPAPLQGLFHWVAQDYILPQGGLPFVSVPLEFRPLRPGDSEEELELISNAQGSPHLVRLHGIALP
jgi:hypothetical protein